MRNRDAVIAAVDAAFAAHPLADLLPRLAAIGIPAGEVRTLDRVYDWEQTRSQGLLVDVEHALAGRVTLPGPPLRFDGDEPLAHAAPPPARPARRVGPRAGSTRSTPPRSTSVESRTARPHVCGVLRSPPACCGCAPPRVQRMRVLIALGGNAMTGPDGSAAPDDQDRAVGVAMQRVADLVAAGIDVVLTHGNGPQVGNLLVKNELAAHVVPPVPLDWCGAQTQGTIGFLILDALDKALADRGVDRPYGHRGDPHPRRRRRPRLRAPDQAGRPLPARGPGPRPDRARPDLGGPRREGLAPGRRVARSRSRCSTPATIATLADAGYVVVGAGGGGIPVVRDPDGTLRGVEAVIDKDLAAALLARAVDAEVLVIATDVEHVVLGYGTADERPLGRVTAAEMRAIAQEQKFAERQHGPEGRGRRAVRGVRRATRSVITSLEMIEEAVHGRAGTVIEAGRPGA